MGFDAAVGYGFGAFGAGCAGSAVGGCVDGTKFNGVEDGGGGGAVLFCGGHVG